MMFFSKSDELIMSPFLHYINKHPKERLILEWQDGTKILTQLDTAGETQNEFNEDEEGFEEYFMCGMETVKIISIGTAPVCDFEVGGLFEVNYHNFPDFVRDQDGNILLEKSVLLRQ